MKRIKFNCKKNDNHFYLVCEDDKSVDELRVGDSSEKSWIVIGVKDFRRLKKMIKKGCTKNI
jgi:hypothetical protein